MSTLQDLGVVSMSNGIGTSLHHLATPANNKCLNCNVPSVRVNLSINDSNNSIINSTSEKEWNKGIIDNKLILVNKCKTCIREHN